MDVLIVGAGTMGRWFADAVDASVAFADVDAAAARSAAADVGGRVVPAAVEESGDADGETFDAVCIAVPMGRVAEAIETNAQRAERALLDVSGAMEPAVTAMETHAPDLERVSLHPLFAPDRAPGSIPYVAAEPGPVTEAILADLEAGGNDVIETTPAEHDEAMESVQAAAHAAVLAFALAAEPAPDGFETPIYAGLRSLVERMTAGAGTPRVYADIQRTFDGADEVAAAAERIAAADPAAVERFCRDAADRWGVEVDSESGPGPEGDHDGRST